MREVVIDEFGVSGMRTPVESECPETGMRPGPTRPLGSWNPPELVIGVEETSLSLERQGFHR
jgi:hypothetical protein